MGNQQAGPGLVPVRGDGCVFINALGVVFFASCAGEGWSWFAAGEVWGCGTWWALWVGGGGPKQLMELALCQSIGPEPPWVVLCSIVYFGVEPLSR